MVTFMQSLISMFTVGGRPNPTAYAIWLAIIAGGALAGYKYSQMRLEYYEVVRQCNVVGAAAAEKLESVNKARVQKDEAFKAIDNDNFTDEYFKRLQLDD